jgi:GT2 family glycosyltransferase
MVETIVSSPNNIPENRYEVRAASDNRSLISWLNKKTWQNKRDRYIDCFESVIFLNNIDSPAISIIVISWRLHADNLINFQILAEQRHQNYELIFVDNGGKDGEFNALMPYIDTYVRLNTNTGAYLARNVGAVFAKAPILLFLEDDGIPEHNLVEAHLEVHRKYDVIAVRGVYSPKKDSAINKMAGHYYLGDVPYPYPSNLEGNSSYRADSFYYVEGWDDDILFGYGGWDLAVRLLNVEPDQRKQIYSPAPVIYHDFAADAEHLAVKLEKHSCSLLRLKAKHPEWDAITNSWNKFAGQYDALILKNNR